MRICFFGTYNLNYARNSSLRVGLKENGVDVVEVHAEIPNERMELSEDFTLKKTINRVWRKVKVYSNLLSQYQKVIACDYVFVLHPGHLDLPFAWILCRLGNKKLIFDTSISPYDTMFVGRNIAKRNSFKARLVKLIEKLLLRFPDRLFVDTKLMKEFIVKEFGINCKKIFVVPLGANDEVYKPSSDGESRSSQTKVLFFGLYNPLHGVQHIMNAIKLLRKEKNINFTMIGDGYLKDDLIHFAKINKLKNVRFIGFMPEKELVEYIQNTDIMLGVFSNSPVFQRAIPNKVFAAIACRKPLISAKHPPMDEYFKHEESVYFCKPEDPKELANAIKKLAHDKALQNRMALSGYILFIKYFTPKQIGKILKNNLLIKKL